MRFFICGSCSGTEPMPGRHHTSWLLEQNNGDIDVFDAGEGCAHTLYTAGYNPLKIRRIFISHSHIDHTGGLVNLLWTMLKLSLVKAGYSPRLEDYDPINVDIYAPEPEVIEPLLTFMEREGRNRVKWYKFNLRKVTGGVVYSDADVTVESTPSYHLAMSNRPAFSYRVTHAGVRAIFSGDVATWRDDLPFLREGCDLMFMETGHHSPTRVVQEMRDAQINIKQLVFLHHGRTILNAPREVYREIKTIYPNAVAIAYDGMEFTEKDLGSLVADGFKPEEK